ncbi:MAG: MotA/TolQ/ExbB proton channel family protein [Planctomycetota bacterium]
MNLNESTALSTETGHARRKKPARSTDFGTVIGLGAGVVLVLASILMASDLAPFIDFASMVMVGGGAVCAALVSFPLQNILGVAAVLGNCFLTRADDPRGLIAELVRLAQIARREGVLALDAVAEQTVDPFVKQGIQMVVDGTDPEMIETVMMSDVEALEARHADGKALFDNVGRFAPSFGLIGTLVGLVVMLKNLQDPASIGPAMAVALLTTLYGALIANVIALPIAEKLGRRSREEVLLKMIVVRGVLAIQAGDNPRIVAQKLSTFLPLGMRRSMRVEKAA